MTLRLVIVTHVAIPYIQILHSSLFCLCYRVIGYVFTKTKTGTGTQWPSLTKR